MYSITILCVPMIEAKLTMFSSNLSKDMLTEMKKKIYILNTQNSQFLVSSGRHQILVRSYLRLPTLVNPSSSISFRSTRYNKIF